MAEILARLRKKGVGKPKETLLWRNSQYPSQPTSFAAQDVTLSDSILNYDFIRICMRRWGGGTSIEYNVFFPAKGLATFYGNAYPYCFIAFGATGASYNYTRRMTCVANNKLHFDAGSRIGTSGGDNAEGIPYQIFGIKMPYDVPTYDFWSP